MRAKHCQACQHCVRRYDHHCPWIENCVGERNHPLFVVYLAVQLAVLLWALQVAWSLAWTLSCPGCGVSTTSSSSSPSSSSSSSPSWCMHCCWFSHLYLKCRAENTTALREFMSRHRISYLKQCKEENPFDQGIFHNLWRFFCACRLVSWENLYFQGDGDTV
uniref:Uncharacterized protein n=1 Tax=Sphaerodactylus townsendi TaxID=933632 RepID=A0ACB8F030_9SAUR